MSSSIKDTTESYAVFDRTEYPNITVTFTGAKATDENFKDYLEGLTRNYDGNERITIIFDAVKANFPGLKYQQMQGKWLKENEELMKQECLGIAYVIPSGLIRNALKLIFSIQGQPVPYKVCENIGEAKSWVKGL